MGVAIRARQLTKLYRRAPRTSPALSSVDLEIPTGGVYGLIGRNGAGKTTFVRIAATQLLPTSGEVDVLGFDAVGRPGPVRERIACVPQESRPLYFLTVDQLVFLYLRMRGMERAEARRRTDGILRELGLDEIQHRQVSRLSGGQRRRAMVAMVLATDAELLFLDEPTTGLDPLARREVWQVIRQARAEQRTVVLTTHYLDEAEALSARLALLEGGRVRLEGTPSELRARVKYPYRVLVEGTARPEELRSYGPVRAVDGGQMVFAREADARALALEALHRGLRVSISPVTLEDVFLEVVGRRLEDPEEGRSEP